MGKNTVASILNQPKTDKNTSDISPNTTQFQINPHKSNNSKHLLNINDDDQYE